MENEEYYVLTISIIVLFTWYFSHQQTEEHGMLQAYGTFGKTITAYRILVQTWKRSIHLKTTRSLEDNVNIYANKIPCWIVSAGSEYGPLWTRQLTYYQAPQIKQISWQADQYSFPYNYCLQCSYVIDI
jgi:hypothetical protein